MNEQLHHQSRITIQSAVEVTGMEDLPSLLPMLDHTDVQAVHGVPTVVTKRPVSIKSLAGGDDTAWQLASVLFDNNSSDISAFWQALVKDSTSRSINEAQTPEEKTIACLAGNWIVEACKNLLAGKNFRLATLLTAIGANANAKKDVRQQLKDWQETNVLSEMSEPIRAIYEILAGNTSVCDGVKGVPIENRVDSFVISQRFNLDWTQSFGLCLWHGGHATVQEAVRSFQDAIEQDREAEPDSPLWVLLKLFAEGRVDYSYYRLDWQLTRALYSNGNVTFGPGADEKLDEMTTSFASELLAKDQWVPAVFVLTHLSSPTARASAIREQLGRNAGLIDEKDTSDGGIMHTLTNKLNIPASWIWEAKALHARSVLKDSVAEFAYLLLAEDFAEANRTFLKRVAPIAIIRREYTSLYEYAKLLYHIKDKLPDWETGAAVYLLFPATRNWDSAQPPPWIDRLVEGLLALKAKTKVDDTLEVAAIADMAEELVVLGRKLYKQGWGKLYKMAGSLPLAEDKRQILLREQVFEGLGVGAA
jgi:nuclear pore complex protein Nup98-Nup96